MSKIKIIVDAITGDITERPLNAEELAQQEIDNAKAEIYDQTLAETAAAKTALLAKLGITEEEAKLLLS